MKEQKVYVAIVTYNRKEYLLNLLEVLFGKLNAAFSVRLKRVFRST